MTDPISTGTLRVHVRTAGGVLPVRGARITVSTAAASPDGDLLHILYSDPSGTVPEMTLPAPPASNSLSPDEGGDVCTEYTVTADCPGYYPVLHSFVPVYAGVVSVQTVLLIPTAVGVPSPSGYLVYDRRGIPAL